MTRLCPQRSPTLAFVRTLCILSLHVTCEEGSFAFAASNR